MAKQDKVTELKQKSRFAAMEGFKPRVGLPVPARRAMRKARKASKKLPYPVPPYSGAWSFQLYQWGRQEWWKLGKEQRRALPFIVLSALLPARQEVAIRAKSEEAFERAALKRMATAMYPAPDKSKRRKLLGIIPLPKRK